MVVVQVTGNTARRRELGACLRAYRQLIPPAEAGLPVMGRRRTPGLRREEVSALSGVGLSWYTWLEQGRVGPSGHVLDAIAAVLRLDVPARAHLRSLAGSTPEPAPVVDPDRYSPLLESWSEHPAVLLDHRLDMVAGNRAWVRRLGDPRDLDPSHRHALQQLAVQPRTADHLSGADALIRSVATRFRMAANLYAGDDRIAEARAMLREDAPHLGPVWDCRAVGAFDPPEVQLDGRPATAHLLSLPDRDLTSVLVIAARE